MNTLIKFSLIVSFICFNHFSLPAQTTTDALKSTMSYDPSKMFQTDQTQLLQAKKITISVTGAVKNPGSYIFNSSDRVDRALQMAELYDELIKQDKVELLSKTEIFERKLDKFKPDNVNIPDSKDKEKPRRNVLLYRRTGDVIKVDIPKYFATRDEKWNPFLYDGDIVFVPRFDKKKDVIAVYGGVNVQGQIEYSEGDRIADAVQLAYGFTSRAVTDSIVLVRYSTDNASLHEEVVNWTEIQKSLDKNLILQPGDRIVVPEREDRREDYHVTVSGEIRFPGIYPITRNQTKLSEIIQKAGGVTDNASLKSASVYRNDIVPKDVRMELLMTNRGNTTVEDTTNFIIENEVRLNRGVVSLDFEKLIMDNDKNHDVILKSGDVINIPSALRTVYVYGQVVLPGNIPFVEGEDVEYYVNRAGGFTDHSREGDVMIIKRGTRQWLSPSETKIEEGDYVWVPKQPERSFSYYMTVGSQAASIISVAVSIVLVIIQVRLLNK
ncbi:MAG: SLBB domain-containing protein [Bacteroidetes bacterium]|nr:SLBB domain-containing protein [Bacteroidota bacterium]